MRYALLINEDPGAYAAMTADERAAMTAEYASLSADARIVGGEHLQPPATATTVRVRDGEALLTDGPFADTKEIFGGFFIVDATDLDGALEVAARIPAARLGGGIEVRAIVEH